MYVILISLNFMKFSEIIVDPFLGTGFEAILELSEDNVNAAHCRDLPSVE